MVITLGHVCIYLHVLHVHTYMYVCTICVRMQDCDGFTRNFLRRLGVRVPAPLDCPSDPYTSLRAKVHICIYMSYELRDGIIRKEIRFEQCDAMCMDDKDTIHIHE